MVLRELVAAEAQRRARISRYDWRGERCTHHTGDDHGELCRHSRPSQRLPDGAWRIWAIMAGRGWGKTRTGAEAVREWSERYSRIGLIAPTKGDAREIMVEGESGILAVFPPDRPARYIANRLRIEFPSGSIGSVYTADEPDRLRGPQHSKLWADEIAVWRYPEAWDMAMFGLRLGDNPQVVATFTPKPTPLVKSLHDRAKALVDPMGKVILTFGSTYENAANLAPTFLSEIIRKYEGTRLGRQELHAELIEDIPGALWLRAWITQRAPHAWDGHGGYARVVVAIDPAVTSGEESDETGIIVAAIGEDGFGYVIEDLSGRMAPAEWARRAVMAYRRHAADRIVAEANQGGDLVSTVIRTFDPNVPISTVHASRGKRTRAEPVAALYEQGRVFHVEQMAVLEDQMCSYTGNPGEASPDRMDALVWALSDLFDLRVDGWGSGEGWGGKIGAMTA